MTLRPNQRKALEALALGHTVQQSAIVAGVSEPTVYRWRTENEFKSELQALTDQKIATASLYLSNGLRDAFKTMIDLSQNAESESTRLQASKAIAESALKIREHHEIVNRIAELERQLQQ